MITQYKEFHNICLQHTIDTELSTDSVKTPTSKADYKQWVLTNKLILNSANKRIKRTETRNAGNYKHFSPYLPYVYAQESQWKAF